MLFHARVIIRHQFFELQSDNFIDIRNFIETIPVEFGCRMRADSNMDGAFISDDEVIGMFHITENDEYKQYLIARDYDTVIFCSAQNYKDKYVDLTEQ